VFAADVCSGQTKVMAQEIAQQQTRLNGTFITGTIDGYTNIEKMPHNNLLLSVRKNDERLLFIKSTAPLGSFESRIESPAG
jgi:riboflavin synthase alpha subunit